MGAMSDANDDRQSHLSYLSWRTIRCCKASRECRAIVQERFDAFLAPPSTAVPGQNADF
jgi:hypothetical protein